MEKIKDVPDLVNFLEVLKKMVERQRGGAAATGKMPVVDFAAGKAEGLEEAIRAAKSLLTPDRPAAPAKPAPTQAATITSNDLGGEG
jgi:hypothetical protein